MVSYKEIMKRGHNAMCELNCNYLTNCCGEYEDRRAKELAIMIFKALNLGQELVEKQNGSVRR